MNRKLSLITAIKIVQNDHNTNKQSTWSWNVVKNRKPNQNETTQRAWTKLWAK
jgi:hypothetical protein